MLIQILAVPVDSGVPHVRMGRGPDRLLEAGLADHLAAAGHSVDVETVDVASEPLTPEPRFAGDLCARLRDHVATAQSRGAFPLVLAGPCYTTLGVLAGLEDSAGTAVLWFDAHGDLNTPETSGSGFLDGMAISMITGRAWQEIFAPLCREAGVTERHVCLVGARDLDPAERLRLGEGAIQACPPPVREADLARAADAMGATARQRYLHLDLDVLDPAVGRANALAAPGGLDVDDVVRAVAGLGRLGPLRGAAVTAYDPAYDAAGAVQRAAFEIITRVLATVDEAP